MKAAARNSNISLSILLLTATLHGSMLTGLAQTNLVLSLDGNGSYITIPSAGDLQNPDEITIEAWIFPTNSGYFIQKGDAGFANSARTYELGWNRGSSDNLEFSIFLGTSTWGEIIVPAPAGQWVHVAATYNSFASLFQLYTNGVLAGSTTNAADGFTPLNGQKLRQTTLPLVLGGELTHPLGFVSGRMDEVRVWNKARSQQEIAGSMYCRLTGAETNLVGYWNFDDGTASDLTGHGHNGAFAGNVQVVSIGSSDAVHSGACITCAPTPSGMVAWWPGDGNAIDIFGGNNGDIYGASYAPGIVGQAFRFDGSGNIAAMVFLPTLSLTNAISLEAWVRHDQAVTNAQRYVCLWPEKCILGCTPSGIYFSLQVAGKWRVLPSTFLPKAGTFHHVAGTYDGAVQRLFIDGALAKSTAAIGPLTPTDSNGATISTGFEPMNGLVDEARLYSRALSFSEIKAIADAGSQGLCSTPSFITTPPKSRAIRMGESATLSVTATGSLPLAYQWYQGVSGNTNGLIAGATNSVYTASGLSTNTSFWVSVKNVLRTVDSSTATVTVVSAETPILAIEAAYGLAWLTIDALPGTLYRVEYTTNPRSTNWTTLTTISLSSTPYTYIDPTSANVPMRFYRLVKQ